MLSDSLKNILSSKLPVTWLAEIFPFLIGNGPSSNGPFSIAMLVYQRVHYPSNGWNMVMFPTIFQLKMWFIIQQIANRL